MIEKKEVLKISKLSRLSIEESKIDSFLKNFSDIIEYIDLLDQSDTAEISKDEKIVEYSVRDDSVIEKLKVEDVVKNSAKVENNFLQQYDA